MPLIFADKAKQMGGTNFTPLPKWESFRVDNATILWEPGVFAPEGGENRVNICIKSDEGVAKIQEYEKSLSGSICSCVKGEGDFEHIKAKLVWDKVRFFDVAHERVEKPPRLTGHSCNLIFNIKGKWASRSQNGLSLEVADIQLLAPKEVDTKSPFM